ncbi:MAG: hypothetical protein H8D22_08220 [Candidatus Cloacimonetes bacterium]|nr:hypothetical protein [Candidatus Cloacimonadota bacterium]
MNKLKKVDKFIINLSQTSCKVKVYTTLFCKKEFSSSEIQELLNIPTTKVYEILHQLINKSFYAEKNLAL